MHKSDKGLGLMIIQNKYTQWGIIVTLTIYQIVRLIIFINVYGGLEQDSGWFLGLARSLAETGSYTTMVSTIADTTPGGHRNIYGQYNVQDENGRVYFFTESGVFVAGIIPNTIIIKLFGPGFWQYRIGPLLFYTLSLLLTAYLLYRFAGLYPVLLTHLFLFFYPNLTIFMSYEAMGEIFGLGYILLTFVMFVTVSQMKTHRTLWFTMTGIMAGIAIITKPITLLSLSGLPLAWLWLFIQKHSSLKEGLLLVGGWLAMPPIWELVQMAGLTLLFDFQTYQNHLSQRTDFFANEGGSGLGVQGNNNLPFFLYKLLMVREISSSNQIISTIVFLIILCGGLMIIWQYREDKFRRNTAILLWGGWFTHSLWFITLSKSGWMRHNWYALIWGLLIVALLTTILWQRANRSPGSISFVSTLALTGVLLFSFASQRYHTGLLISDDVVEQWYQTYLAEDHTRIPWSLVSRQAQQDAVDFITNLPPTAHIFYPEGHKSAEMAVLTGRILYPIQRRNMMSPNKDDVILIGPSLISRWRKPTEAHISQIDQRSFINEIMKQVQRECPHILFENGYYIICATRDNLR